ncbi:putative membrane protein [Clostridium bornimense]|uniref:Putative membrane protein n=1 Tax=Clostridium bornimense TaxID=1216932 RepID=W6S0C8_9CLOT|nr:hypothetical protein [Clostridium bornimense]CDM67737.1 putative membrane protein [Clostridium bornimense]
MKRFYKLACCYIIFCLIFFCALVLYGVCINWYKGNRPCDQPSTEWVSEDGSIKIHVDENQQATGSMNIKGTEIPFIFENGPGERVWIYSIEAKGRLGLYPEEEYETWMGNFNREDKFTVTVEKTTYFEVGQKITFYRVDDEDDSSK